MHSRLRQPPGWVGAAERRDLLGIFGELGVQSRPTCLVACRAAYRDDCVRTASINSCAVTVPFISDGMTVFAETNVLEAASAVDNLVSCASLARNRSPSGLLPCRK